MKKFITLTLLMLILICPILAEDVSATSVFLTSDNVLGHDEDIHILNQIANYIEETTDGSIQVIIDNDASNPGEGTRAMASGCDYSVTIAYPCAGNLEQLGIFSVNSPMKLIFVNAGSLDLNQLNFLRRAYDDNWSVESFAAINSPGKFLADSGVILLQPNKELPDETDDGNLKYSDKVCEYIANSVINQIKSNNIKSQVLDTDLIVTHKISPRYLAETSKEIVDNSKEEISDRYGYYTTPQALYMSASYLVGYGLSQPGNFENPDNPEDYSFFTKKYYSFYDYATMADIVVDYMNEHKKAPNSIDYEGARISYYDLVYNFALLTENQTDASHMNFPREMEFTKYKYNILFDIIPIVAVISVILGIVLIIKKIKNKRKMKKIRYQSLRNRDYYPYTNQYQKPNKKRRYKKR